jgi:hypothetical protein
MQLDGPELPAGLRRGPRLAVEDLSVYEMRGGHTLRKHVAVPPDEALRRVRAGEHAAGSFSDRRTAQQAVEDAIQAHRHGIAAWLWGPAAGTRYAFVERLRRVVGSTLTRNDVAHGVETPSPATAVRVVLQASDELPAGFSVLTAYPTRPHLGGRRTHTRPRRMEEGVPA